MSHRNDAFIPLAFYGNGSTSFRRMYNCLPRRANEGETGIVYLFVYLSKLISFLGIVKTRRSLASNSRDGDGESRQK